jgi:hypothetical protein
MHSEFKKKKKITQSSIVLETGVQLHALQTKDLNTYRYPNDWFIIAKMLSVRQICMMYTLLK